MSVIGNAVAFSKRCVKGVAKSLGLEEQVVGIWISMLKRSARNRIRKDGLRAIEHLHKCLEGEDVLFFVDYGTLLGLVREGKLLDHDLDIDMGVIVNSNNTRSRVRRALMSGGFKAKFEFYLNDLIAEDSYTWKKVKLDVIYYEANDDKCVSHLFYCKPGKTYLPGHADTVGIEHPLLEGTNVLEVNGYQLNAPSDPEAWLAVKYGENWRVPDKGWVYWKGPSAKPVETQGVVVHHK